MCLGLALGATPIKSSDLLVKSPRAPGRLYVLYRFLRCRRHRPTDSGRLRQTDTDRQTAADFCSCDNFRMTSWIFFHFG